MAGDLFPETLAQVASLTEEHRQKQSKSEGNRQLGLNLHNSLTIQFKRRYISTMSSTIEVLWDKYEVMTHMWLLTQMRQLGRPLYVDLTEPTFNRFLDELFWFPNPLRGVEAGPSQGTCDSEGNLISLSRSSLQNGTLDDIVDDLARQFQLQFYRLGWQTENYRLEKKMIDLAKRQSDRSRAPRRANLTAGKAERLAISDEQP